MRGFRLTERRVALLCAIVLATLSVTAAWRQHTWQQSTGTAQNQSREETDWDDETAQPGDSTINTTPREKKSDGSSTSSVQSVHTYTAIAGSSYTEFARQAIASYAQTHSLQLSADQLINAEVQLANAAGSPELEIGQQVTISPQDVSQALQAAGVATEVASTPTGSSTPSPQATSAQQTFTAAAGDSYTTLARQCITLYAQAHNLTLTSAQRVAAETYVTQAARAPLLDIGQQVTVSQASVSQAVQRAQQLSANELASWQPYADTVAW